MALILPNTEHKCCGLCGGANGGFFTVWTVAHNYLEDNIISIYNK
jgi:hypothetical protein